MRVAIFSHYDETEQIVTGSPYQIESKLLERFPHLHSGDADHQGDIEALVEQIDSMQAYSAEIVPDNNQLQKAGDNLYDEDLGSETIVDMLGFNPGVHPTFAAARFLAGRPEAKLADIRRALYDRDGDYVDAAIQLYHLPETEDSRQAIAAVIGLGSVKKAESQPSVPPGQDIEAGTPDANSAADAVRKAFQAKTVRVAHLDGKHSRGSLIAKDAEDHHVLLLKPGSGGPGLAAGAAEEPASQSRREAAFWQIAQAWGLGESVPRADLVIIDGREYAAIEMLPFDWRGLQKRLDQDPRIAGPAFDLYRDKGLIHRWAILDWVAGNGDRHADNIMISPDGKLLALIDHGSAFAGPDFDPGHDQNSFVPAYLRAWAGKKFNSMPFEQKLSRMPTVNSRMGAELKTWLDGIHVDQLQGLLNRFGIDPGPTVERLAKLKIVAGKMPVDVAINRLWVIT